jgi:hypothetical protein
MKPQGSTGDAAREEKRPFYRFRRPGTLVRPGPIGRAVRLLLGLALAFAVWQLVMYSDVADLRYPLFWFWALFSLWLLPAVVNIGFGRIWGNWPLRLTAVGLAGVAALTSHFVYGQLDAPPLWWVVWSLMTYTLGHLGISFLLAALLGTPGCEMRAIPHLIGLITSHARREHYCPGFLDRLDHWEARRNPS